MKKIGIINSGGDCAGLNAVIAALVKRGIKDNSTFVGFIKGWEGLLSKEYIDLDIDKVRGISHIGGTILKTTNRGRFAGKKGSSGGVNVIPTEILAQAKASAEDLGLDGLIVIGGDGTLSAALQLSNFGVPVVGVPKTIDNDLSGTDSTFGFSTAVDIAADAIDKIHTTASSHDRVFFVECMGRHAGWISLYAGLAANANAILLPEFPVSINHLTDFIKNRMLTRGSTIVVVAEGIKLDQDIEELAGVEIKLRGVSERLLHLVDRASEGQFDLRHVVLGHTQRGGRPNVTDRLLAKKYGIAAYENFIAQNYGHMVTYVNGEISCVPIVEATGNLKRVALETPELIVAKKLGIYVNS